MEKIIRVLGIMLPKYADEKWKLSKKIPEKERPVVFIGPFEHHSNELSWRESIATVVVIPEGRDGCPNMRVLEEKLILFKKRPIKIGSFSAGSNVTGIRIDTKRMTLLLHKVHIHVIGYDLFIHEQLSCQISHFEFCFLFSFLTASCSGLL
jgi:selenocysteine lyase/cysteine desulfurase